MSQEIWGLDSLNDPAGRPHEEIGEQNELQSRLAAAYAVYMQPKNLTDHLTYCSYKTQRQLFPHTTPEQWATIFGPKALEMELLYEMENMKCQYCKAPSPGSFICKDCLAGWPWDACRCENNGDLCEACEEWIEMRR